MADIVQDNAYCKTVVKIFEEDEDIYEVNRICGIMRKWG